MKHPRSTKPATCTACRRRKAARLFNANNKKTNGLQSRCKSCAREAAQHPDRQLRARAAHMKHKYGVDQARMNEMLMEQDGKCAICREVPDEHLCVDHCHSTGEVRGLLCRRCNAGLGSLQDSLSLLQAAVRYLGGAPCR